MKNRIKFLFIVLFGSSLLFSCMDEVKSTYSFRTMMPVYLEMKDVRAKEIYIAPAQ